MNNIIGTSTFQAALELLCKLEVEKIKMLRKELKDLPKGSLYINKSKGLVYFECAQEGQRRIINKDIDLIYQLARKRYLKLRLREYDEHFNKNGEWLKIKSVSIDTKIRKVLTYYGELGLDVMRITCSVEQYRWTHSSFVHNTQYEEDKIYSTYSGIKVRTKSEQKIGNELELNGIPYRYEQAISVYVLWMEGILGNNGKGYKTYYPDFTILTITGEQMIWEHLGRVDKEDYRMHNMEKICAYRKSIRDEMLILTFESDLQDSGILQELIARRILQYM